ncbi:vitamin K epoxide reductase family protein [Minwuia thermotolerans]|uniref:DNA polymerase III subunit epsilon n=1 Tax=Minwuia thermotolerans TaxID=2056226 RepID=A0A2M9FXM0_9PROT|nr:vitamin K epoxide reductase family protein [Minwuia thermotolerans]PJK28203.1 DNA polymerase III subunit epsilon [Minwuia thermotolerans]
MARNNKKNDGRPIVLITGAAGGIGTALAEALSDRFHIVGMDMPGLEADCELIEFDLTDDASVAEAFEKFRARHGGRIASVVHLAAYFDFTGEDHPLYDAVNVEGTRRVLRRLQDFEVEQFVYSSTMLVHEPCELGAMIDEDSPIGPKWAYPKSKAESERVIAEEHGDIPVAMLRLAGMYDGESAIPTLSQQIARIYERDPKSHLYAGDQRAGQAVIHQDDVVELFRRTVERRKDLPEWCPILAGEEAVMSYAELQDEIGRLIHGEGDWTTVTVPAPVAKAGAWAEVKGEPVIPDDFDHGEPPFIRPFMVDMASDHFMLNTRKARDLLGWEPRRRLREELPGLVDSLKTDPAAWYDRNGIVQPYWMQAAEQKVDNAEDVRARHEAQFRREHRNNLWGHWTNMGLAFWLMTSPPLLDYQDPWMVWSDVASGVALLVFAFISLSWRHAWARWVTAAVGIWVMAAPLVFWAPSGVAYLNGTLVGMLVICFAVAVRPPPGVTAVASQTGPTIPKGWPFSPSSWYQRVPIIVLAVVGLLISRYLAAYQLEAIPGVWEPFFPGNEAGKNGTEEIITSSVSEAWPVPDAGLGALTYALEIIVGLIGSARRWRTMPWLVTIFGIMIVPLGAISIFFIVIQPIMIGTYCTLCLIAAAAMLIQIPYSVDELVATGQFLARRHRAGRPVLRIFFTGDTDEGAWEEVTDDFERSPWGIVREMVIGGVSLPWNLALCLLAGVWLMFTPLVLGFEGTMANVSHLVGSVAITVTVTALAAPLRAVRFLNLVLAACLLATPFMIGAGMAGWASCIGSALALTAFSIRRGHIRDSFGSWDRWIF